jgi:molecular chaperone DnaK
VSKSRIVGIDLGTTYSAVAVVNRHGQPELLPNREGEYLTASVVFFDGEAPVVGTAAKNLAIVEPENVVQFVKRHMGESSWKFITEAGSEYSAEEISAIILRRLADDAAAALGEPIDRAVITVPAYFKDAERQATRDAGKMAGLDVVRIVNEPTAAALAFGSQGDFKGRVVVYDLGGGTFDVTVLDVSEGELRALSTGGDRSLGGVDWDNELISWLDESFVNGGGKSLLDDPRSLQELREKAEKAKLTLSQLSTTKIVLSHEGSQQTIEVTREHFEELTRGLLNRTQVILEETLEDAGLRWPDVSRVLLVGGSTKMPAVATLVQSITGLAPSKEVHPDEVVALGAAILAEVTIHEESASAGHEAAARGAEETGLVEVNISDVTAHSLGLSIVNTQTGQLYNDIVIERGTSLPCRQEKSYFTVRDNQTQWEVKVNQGEEEDLKFATSVGTGTIHLDRPLSNRYPIRVDFSYDVDGLIHIDAFDGQTGLHWGEVEIRRSSNLSDAEVDERTQRIADLSVG